MIARQFGPQLTTGGARFRLWAPGARRVDLLHSGNPHALTRGEDGWFSAEVPGATAGDAL